MKGLYKKVIAVDYPSIPSRYSHDLASILRQILQSNPVLRPSCEQILQFSSTLKNVKDQRDSASPYGDEGLIQTIKLPRVLK
jgi:NIMA (never in mitosis gene a)-related kinase